MHDVVVDDRTDRRGKLVSMQLGATRRRKEKVATCAIFHCTFGAKGQQQQGSAVQWPGQKRGDNKLRLETHKHTSKTVQFHNSELILCGGAAQQQQNASTGTGAGSTSVEGVMR